MIQALIFDFDGLILDTETPALESWRSIYAEYGHDLALELWQDTLGRGPGQGFDVVAHLAELAGKPLDREELLALRAARKQALCEELTVLPGVREVIVQACDMGLPCSVASSSGRDWVEGWLRMHDLLDAFVCVRTADDVTSTKPAPDLFLSAAACMGVEPAACLVFEDSPNGLLAARAAGMRSVAVPCALTSKLALPPADLVLPSLDALPLDQILARLDGAHPEGELPPHSIERPA
jgi:HAD superfamily hydrolase (TIGR01509 family)